MSTFLDLAPLLSPTGDQLEWRESRVRGVEDREIRLFWQEFERQSKNDQERYVRPVLDRVWQLTARPEIMNIIGQSQSSFDMHDVIAGNKILLVNLAGLPSETASLVGTLIMNTIWREVRTGSAPRPNFLYLDEFQTFTNLPIDPQEMFAQARSFGLGLVVAHQHLRQLPPDLDAAVMANTATKLIFQLSARDAGQLSREFGRRVDESDFTNLHKYHCIASLTGDDGSTQTVTLSTPPEAKPLSHATAIRAMSRQRYGRPVSEVYDEIEQRYTVETKPTKKPTASTGWGVINDDLGQG